VQDPVAAGDIAEVAGHWTLKADVDALHQAVPATIRHLVDRQRQRLSPSEQEMLAAASVVGAVFGAPLIAAALECPIADVEDACARLAERQQFVRPGGDVVHWPDGTALERYSFLHAVYRALWQERVGVSTRRVWHQRIGERLERAHGDQAGEIAVASGSCGVPRPSLAPYVTVTGLRKVRSPPEAMDLRETRSIPRFPLYSHIDSQ
jgi:hypothetical protein